jgi:PTH1 family peptidyl-tRNA hydrolase
MKLVVGLGNPGKKYEKTRHNIGFVALDAVQSQLHKIGQMSAWKLNKSFNAMIAEGHVSDNKVILAKPLTFMNRSGDAVALITQYYSLSPKELLVVHDDKDITLGTVQYQFKRGHAGQNGVRSIIDMLGTNEFYRLRIGIKTDLLEQVDTGDFVLGKFSLKEKVTLRQVTVSSINEIVGWLEQ